MHKQRCRYEDCTNGWRIAAEDEQVTCPKCRKYMGLDEVSPSSLAMLRRCSQQWQRRYIKEGGK
jgi:hypothetical protein